MTTLAKVGFTCGSFDLGPHAGHVDMLKRAKSLCTKLVVGLHTDPTLDRPDTKNKPIQSLYERFLQLSACKYVDEVIPYETEEELFELIKLVNPDIRFLDESYQLTQPFGITGAGLVDIIFLPRKHNLSSSNIRKRVLNAHNKISNHKAK